MGLIYGPAIATRFLQRLSMMSDGFSSVMAALLCDGRCDILRRFCLVGLLRLRHKLSLKKQVPGAIAQTYAFVPSQRLAKWLNTESAMAAAIPAMKNGYQTWEGL